jgi:hypothetical protein
MSLQAQARRNEEIAGVLWNEIFYLRERIRHHVKRAEERQVQIKAMEDAAEIEGPRRAQGRLTHRTDQVQDPAYQVGAVLRDNVPYKNLVGDRNSHQAQVKMYALALSALVASNPPQLNQFEVPEMTFFVQTKPKGELPT